MKNKKGFTLIELLAVIVILAIIALIAVPIILNMINNARKSAAKSSLLGYVDSIEAYSGFRTISDDAELKGYDVDLPDMENGQVTCTKTSSGWNSECEDFFNAVDQKAKGKKPDTATVIINEDGRVLTGTKMTFNGYEVTYDGNDAEIGGQSNTNNNNNNNNSSVTTNSNIGNLVYFDPVSTDTCDSEHTSNSTCYKWRIIGESGSNYTVQMDHNLVNKCKWSSNGLNNTFGPDKAMSSLAEVTTTWVRVPALNYTYNTTNTGSNYGVLECTNGTCKLTKDNVDKQIATNVKARLITGEEVRAITLNAGASSNSVAGKWTSSASYNDTYHFSNNGYVIGMHLTSGTGDTSLSWLIENTKNYEYSGAKANTYGEEVEGYWSLSPVSNNQDNAWIVNYTGSFTGIGVAYANLAGSRPVITMPKSVFRS